MPPKRKSKSKRPGPPTRVAARPSRGFDVDELLARVDTWCQAQRPTARLVRGALFTSFERWFTSLVDVVTSRPLSLDRDDIVRAVYQAGDWRPR